MIAEAFSNDPFDLDRIADIAARLELREPNKEALESIVFEIGQHYVVDREPPPLEAVVDVATGVGKTYILAAAIEYLAGDGIRDFAVITPGRTILEKTVANFTPGSSRSLLGGMEVRPIVITSDNFATAAMRAAMDDPSEVKLYIFTVQALIKPQSKVGRKTHKFQEGLGEAFYAHLQGLQGLVVFADEHHTYYGPAFSNAIRDLLPHALIGLTATPHKNTPKDRIIYRYPLSAAIADKLVKTPVLVGRKDDRTDPHTKLLDGVRLLEYKARMIERYRAGKPELEQVNPVMLVIAPTIAEAEEIQAIVQEPTFADGRFADKVLTVHSDAPDEALAALDRLEEPSSPYRIVVSVGMLKEGWDVKNVYVIASLRASVSDILTEQTLGRGMRLPFGQYTGIELLDTLEVLGHERYEELLKKAGVINQQFIDWRTRSSFSTQNGRLVRETQEVLVQPQPVKASTDQREEEQVEGADQGLLVIDSVEAKTARAEEDVMKLQVELPPRPDFHAVKIPQLKMSLLKNEFSVADITNLRPFRDLGEKFAADPAGSLRRVVLSARVVEGADGIRRTELVTNRAEDRVESPAALFPLEELRRQLVARVLGAPIVPARPNEVRAIQPILDAFIKGLGDQAEKILSGYLDRAAAGLIQEITRVQREYTVKPSYTEVVELSELKKVRLGRTEVSTERLSSFKKGMAYEGYKKSLYSQDWFDSSTEREMANILEDEDDTVMWVRLQIGDLPVLWSTGREYNPDFIAIDRNDVHWVIEVKMDKEMQSADVQGKREAALRWANHVSADEQVAVPWRYLLVSESDIKTAKGSWDALRKLGGYS